MFMGSEGLCACGCGLETNRAKRRYVYPDGRIIEKGEHYAFVANHHRRLSPVEYVVNESGCWIWQRALDKDGYGIMSKPRYRAHRWYFEQSRGPIPEGMMIDHLCRVHACVNPQHLEAVLPGENIRRGQQGILKVSCKMGHPWVEENIYISPSNGRRSCLICRRQRAR